MLLTAVVLADRLRPTLPAALLSLSSLPYAAAAVGVGVLSPLLPKELFIRIDNAMYSTYQRLVLFVFENLSAVKVRQLNSVAMVTF